MSRTTQGRDPQGRNCRGSYPHSGETDAQDLPTRKRCHQTSFDAPIQFSRVTPSTAKLAGSKRKWDQTKGESRAISKIRTQKLKLKQTIKKPKQDVVAPWKVKRSHPPINGGQVRTASAKWHNCSINVLLAALFGKSTAEEVQP